MTTLYQLQLKEEPDEEEKEGREGEDSDTDESYDDVEIAPMKYTDKTLMDSEDLPAGYVHLLKNKRKDKRGEGETSRVIIGSGRRQNEYGESVQLSCHLDKRIKHHDLRFSFPPPKNLITN